MKVEASLKALSSILTKEITAIQQQVADDELKTASDNLFFVKGEINRLVSEIVAADGKKIGIAGKIFRHPYHVPDEIKQNASKLSQRAAELDKQLDKKIEKARNSADRAAARARRTQEDQQNHD